VTEPPVTEPPVTEPPVTEPPATEAPAITEAPMLTESPSPAMSEAPSPSVSGTIVLPTDAVTPAGATWTVEIQDTTLADAPAATIGEVTSIVADPAATVIPFDVPYDPAVIDPLATYTLRAVVEDATPVLLYTSDTVVPVITGGAPTSGVVIEVVAAVSASGADASMAPMESATP
jgi:uncharacterized lipoprotein YbaY